MFAADLLKFAAQGWPCNAFAQCHAFRQRASQSQTIIAIDFAPLCERMYTYRLAWIIMLSAGPSLELKISGKIARLQGNSPRRDAGVRVIPLAKHDAPTRLAKQEKPK